MVVGQTFRHLVLNEPGQRHLTLYRYLFPAMWISWVIYWWISGDQFRKTSRGAMASGNIEGDPQSDPSVHGGPQKAVYAYPAEHYDFWRHELPDAELAWGAFGENFPSPTPFLSRP